MLFRKLPRSSHGVPPACHISKPRLLSYYPHPEISQNFHSTRQTSRYFVTSPMKFTEIFTAKIFRSRKKSASLTSQNSSCSASSEESISTPTSVIPRNHWNDVVNGEVRFDLAHVFQMIDADRDGKIRKEELGDMLNRIGGEKVSVEEMDLMLSKVDADGDGCISLEEFRLIGEAFAPPTCDIEVRCTFDFFDADGDGRITAEELYKVFKTIGDSRCTIEDCRRMIRSVDRKCAGFVCFDDFSRMMELHTLSI